MASTKSRELIVLCGELAQWRRDGGGGGGKRIPEAVCQQAAAVAQVDGVLATARATRLKPGVLPQWEVVGWQYGAKQRLASVPSAARVCSRRDH
jgi:hypothetical protein